MSHDGIVVADVTKRYGSVVALEAVSLTVEPGSYHCLVGANGSGKSTLLRIILGLTRPDSGEVTRPDIADIGCGFQRPNFYSGLTVRENIRVFASLVGADDWEWNQRVVDELRLNPALDRRAAELSGGFARKLDLALALIKRPSYLLLDEPLGALDDVSRVRFLEFLAEYTEQGNAVFVSSHRIDAFEPYLDRVTLMHQGRAIRDASPEDIDRPDDQSLQAYYVATVLDREGVEFEETLLE